MIPTIATVVDAHPWEEALVTTARLAGLARVRRRCIDPAEVESVVDEVDVLVVGGDTPWVSAPLLARWSSRTSVVGVVAGDTDPMRAVLSHGGCAAVLDRSTPPAAVLGEIAFLERRPRFPQPVRPSGKVVAVIGPRGAPGISEIALAMAWIASASRRTLLVELDHEAPSLGLRLGLPPGRPSRPAQVGRLEVLTAPLGSSGLSAALMAHVLVASRQAYSLTVTDRGTGPGPLPDDIVLVSDTSPAGLVRTARLLSEWTCAAPILVANRTDPADEGSLRRLRAATGLEPAAVVPSLPRIEWGEPPPPAILTRVTPVLDLLWRDAGALVSDSRSIGAENA